MAPNNPTKVFGDPRRPNEARPYSPSLFTKDRGGVGEVFTLAALLCGMGALLLKMKFFVWICVLCCFLAIANGRGSEAEVKQLVSAMCLAAFGIFSTYFEPIPRQ